MAFWTYLLLCADGVYYTGHTEDLERRFGEHQSGLIKGFTSSRLPVQLVWADYFQTRAEAIENELRVKKWSKAKKRALADQDWDKLSYYSKPPSERGSLPPGVSSSLDTNGEGEGNKNGGPKSPFPLPFVSSEDETPINPETPPSKKPPSK
jgi:putative endonuclease